jgi:hypothetical protein
VTLVAEQPSSDARRDARIDRCPECGLNVDRSTSRAAIFIGIDRFAFRFAFGVLTLAVIALIALDWKVSIISSPTPSPIVLEPAWTVGDVRAVAAGTSVRTDRLSAALVLAAPDPVGPGVRTLEVALVDPRGTRHETWSFGWPFRLIERKRHATYADVAERTGLIHAVVNPAARPLERYEVPSDYTAIPARPTFELNSRHLVYQPDPAITGGVVNEYLFRWPALGSIGGLAVIGWWIGGLAHRVASKERRTRRQWSSRGAAAALLLFLVVSLFSMGITEHPIRHWATLRQATFAAPFYFVREGYSRLPASLDDVQSGLVSETELAAMVIQGVLAPADSSPRYLAVASDSAGQLAQGSRSWGGDRLPIIGLSKHHYEQRPDFGPVKPLASDGLARVSIYGDWLRLGLTSSKPEQAHWVLSIAVARLLLVVLAMTGAAALVGWMFQLRRRAQYLARREAGQCTGCGYQVFSRPAVNA